MNESSSNTERLRDLLADQALFELSPEEQAELRQLLAGSNVSADSFEWTAALATVALNPGPHEPLPAELRAKIAAAAPEHLAAARQTSDATRTTLAGSTRPPSGPRLRESIAWLVAAACLLIAFITWSDSHKPIKPVPSIAQLRDSLLKQAPDAVKLNWTAAGDPSGKGATGDVVWSNAKQEGFLLFKGLAKNDPNVDQYQLWIIDPNQKHPIDGGVFDINSVTGDVIVPIHAQLRVVTPQAFAVTVEKPGGVVVSDQDRVALLAKAGD
jgi:anti-sigma-K factor RskA